METITLNFKASGQTLTADANPQRYASNTVNYIQAVFDLDDNWKSFDSVRAVWHNDFACISTVLDSDGACTVPHEVLTNLDEVIVNLVGSDVDGEELVDRMTTYPLRVAIIDANARICGTETAEVTPSQFEQFIAQVAELVGSVRDIDRIELNDDYTLTVYFSDETSWTSTSIRGEQGETGNGIASAVLNDDYTLTLTFTDGTSYTTSSIRGAQGPQGEPGEVTMEQLESVLPTDTASGAIASFEDGSDLFDYLSCVVEINPVQAGSGTPSPDNVRPITGWTGCEVVVSPTEDAQDGTTHPVSWQTEAGTVYGCTVDVVTGVLTVDRASVTLQGEAYTTAKPSFSEVSLGTTLDGSVYIAYMPMIVAWNMKEDNIAMCDEYEFVDKPLQNMHIGQFDGRGSYFRFAIADQTLDTLAKWNNYLASNPMQLVYELATPITYQLDPVQVACLLGHNNVWADCGDVEVQYKADVQRWVEKMLNA